MKFFDFPVQTYVRSHKTSIWDDVLWFFNTWRGRSVNMLLVLSDKWYFRSQITTLITLRKWQSLRSSTCRNTFFLLNLFCSNTILADLTEWSFYRKPRMVTLCTDMNIYEEMIAYLSIGIWLYFVTKIDLIIDDSFRVSLFINFGCLQDLEGAFWHFYDKWTYFTWPWLMEI